VVLLVDPYTAFCETEVAIAATQVLERLGYRVVAAPVWPSLRLALGQGRLGQAARLARWGERRMGEWHGRGRLMVGCDPAETLAWRLDRPRFTGGSAPASAGQPRTVEEFLAGPEAKARLVAALGQRPLRAESRPIFYHPHCHDRAATGGEPGRALLSLLPGVRVGMSTAPCCGMAGAFGYEKAHYPLSQRILELGLQAELAVVASAAPTIVASGLSCRVQLRPKGHAPRPPIALLLDALND
jgi:Fe-S oxidoreductase